MWSNTLLSCRRVKKQLSPYLDERLTGREMLDIREHLDHCQSCHNEYLAIRQVKVLLRSLPVKDPDYALEQKIYIDVTNERCGMLSLPLFTSPKRSRRIAAALVFSCIGILSVSIQIGSGDLEAYHPAGTVQQIHEAIFINLPGFSNTHNTASIFPENRLNIENYRSISTQPIGIPPAIYPTGSNNLVNNHRAYPIFNNGLGNTPNYVTLASSH